MTCEVKCVLASRSSYPSILIHTLQLRYWRAVHAEFMTHRSFCISGDARLDFELPAGNSKNGGRRIYSMSIREFADKWFNGASEGSSSRFNGRTLDHLDPCATYSARDIAMALGFSSALSVNQACREGKVEDAWKAEGLWTAEGSAWRAWRSSMGSRRFSLRSRLKSMQLRQVNEVTGEIQLATVNDCVISGTKEVFRIQAGQFSTVATADHLFFTSEGWKRLGDIKVGLDRVCTYRYGAGAQEDPYRKIDGRWVSRWSLQVRDEVADRQLGLCAETGELLEESFHIHHKIPRHLRPDLAFDVSNVVAVNPGAHRKLHSEQGWQVGVSLGSEFLLVESIEPEGEVDTYDLEMVGAFPNFFADGIVVHNSRNAGSSRATPVNKMLKQVWNDPAGPIHWGVNQAGMQARAELVGWKRAAAGALWRTAGKVMCGFAWGVMKLGLHKQVANRLLEPWQYINVVVTSTEWDNFFELRCHKDAQPEFQELADEIRRCIEFALPQPLQSGEWHLPYLLDSELSLPLESKLKLSAARCARVSIAPFDGDASHRKEHQRHDLLVGSRPIHASPTEHQAQCTGDDKRWANFRGFRQYRSFIETQTTPT